MLPSSWNAKGRVRPVWERWAKTSEIDRAPRDALAERLGTSGSTLSSLNGGTKPMTLKMAQRIAAETGVSVLELGAPEEATDEAGQLLLDRLGALEDQAERQRTALEVSLASIDDRLSRIEARQAAQDARDSGAGP